MAFYLIHELRGLKTEKDGRMRIRANTALPAAAAEDLVKKLLKISGISKAQANPRVGSLLIFYDSTKSRNQALRLLQANEKLPAMKKLMGVQTSSQAVMGGFFPLFRYLCIRPFLPPTLRIVSAAIGAIPFLLKGISALLHGKLAWKCLTPQPLPLPSICAIFAQSPCSPCFSALEIPWPTGHVAIPWNR